MITTLRELFAQIMALLVFIIAFVVVCLWTLFMLALDIFIWIVAIVAIMLLVQ